MNEWMNASMPYFFSAVIAIAFVPIIGLWVFVVYGVMLAIALPRLPNRVKRDKIKRLKKERDSLDSWRYTFFNRLCRLEPWKGSKEEQEYQEAQKEFDRIDEKCRTVEAEIERLEAQIDH